VPNQAPVIFLLRFGSVVFDRLVSDDRHRQNCNAAGPEYAMDFAQRLEVVGNMLEDMARVDEVEAGVVDIVVQMSSLIEPGFGLMSAVTTSRQMRLTLESLHFCASSPQEH